MQVDGHNACTDERAVGVIVVPADPLSGLHVPEVLNEPDIQVVPAATSMLKSCLVVPVSKKQNYLVHMPGSRELSMPLVQGVTKVDSDVAFKGSPPLAFQETECLIRMCSAAVNFDDTSFDATG